MNALELLLPLEHETPWLSRARPPSTHLGALPGSHALQVQFIRMCVCAHCRCWWQPRPTLLWTILWTASQQPTPS